MFFSIGILMFLLKIVPLSIPYYTCDDMGMEIKEHRLLLFIKLYREQFGVTLTREEAYKKASLLIHYAQMCMKPLAKVDEDEIIDMSNVSE